VSPAPRRVLPLAGLLLGAATWSVPAAAESWVFGGGVEHTVLGTGSLTTRVDQPTGPETDTIAALGQPRLRSLRALVGVDTDRMTDQYVFVRVSDGLRAALEDRALVLADQPAADTGLWLDLGAHVEFPSLEAGPVGLGVFADLGGSRVALEDTAAGAVGSRFRSTRSHCWGLFAGGGLAASLAIGKDSGVSLVALGGARYRHLWLAEHSELSNASAARTTLRMVDPSVAVDLRIRI
jgi:hypothetical protein